MKVSRLTGAQTEMADDPVTVYIDPREAMRTAVGPSLIMFPPNIAFGMCVLGIDAEEHEITLAEARIDPRILRRVVRWTPNGRQIMADFRAYKAARKAAES